MRRLAFLLLMAPTLFAQLVRTQPLGVGGDKLYESTAEYMVQHPNCFLPTEDLPSNYKVWRYRDNLGDDDFDCQVTSVRHDHLHLLGFRVQKKSTVLVYDHVAAIFYDFHRADFPQIERKLRVRLGEPTVERIDRYSGRDGCRGKEIHWSNDVSDIVLIDECERDEYGATALNLFYTRRADLVTKPGQ